MNIRVPASGQAAKIAKAFLKTQGIEVKHTQALELVARLHGYKDHQAMQSDVNFVDPLALTAEGSTDFVFKGPCNSRVCITVENISVYVKRGDEGVIVDFYKKGGEDEESLARTYLEYSEATGICEACGGEVHKGYCSDMTCSYRDWPQWVPRAANESTTRFEAQPVDWAVVAAEEDICALKFDKNSEREIVNSNPALLKELAAVKDLSNRLTLSQRAAYEYIVADAGGSTKTIPLGILQSAFEYVPGFIDLRDGRILQLLSQGPSGTYRRFSPALNRYLAV